MYNKTIASFFHLGIKKFFCCCSNYVLVYFCFPGSRKFPIRVDFSGVGNHSNKNSASACIVENILDELNVSGSESPIRSDIEYDLDNFVREMVKKR